MGKTFTIFTGLYNSENVIHRVFKSIESQTCQDFEWIIVDDCSSDNSVSKIDEFRNKHQELDITIYKHQANTGIAVSRKEALTYARGKYFITWDHDDEQDSLQLQTYLALWQKKGTDRVANIFAKMTDQHGKLLGKRFPEEGFVSDYISMHNQYLVGNKDGDNVVEHHVCVKTEKYLEVIQHYDKHPHLLGGRSPNGSDVWGMMAYLGYQTIYSNTPVRTYYINEAGRVSMSSRKRKDGAERIFMNKLLWVNWFDTKLSLAEYQWKLRNIFAVVMYGLLSNNPIGKILYHINHPVKKCLAVIMYLPAKVLATKFRRQ